MSQAFASWLDTFVDEKGLDVDGEIFEIETSDFWGEHMVPLAVVIEAAKNASPREQAAIKNILVQIDFRNGSVLHFFEHLAKGLVQTWGSVPK